MTAAREHIEAPWGESVRFLTEDEECLSVLRDADIKVTAQAAPDRHHNLNSSYKKGLEFKQWMTKLKLVFYGYLQNELSDPQKSDIEVRVQGDRLVVGMC